MIMMLGHKKNKKRDIENNENEGEEYRSNNSINVSLSQVLIIFINETDDECY